MANRTHDHPGFALIELLVVVAVVALLITILLPALVKAREEARGVVCSAALGQLGKAEVAYATTNAEWIPGSPLTTGYYFAANAVSPWPATGGVCYNRFAATWDDYATSLRVQMQDRSIPAPNKPNDEETRYKLIQQAMEGVFHCPSNQETVTPWGEGFSDWATVRAPSYMTMWTLMRGGSAVYHSAKKKYPGARNPSDIGQKGADDDPPWEMAVPDDYMPRHSKLGRECEKVFLADGVRFYEPSTQELTYSPDVRGTKGIWMASPPSTPGSNGREYNLARTLSYRHGAKDRINAAFFDGHVATLFVAGHRAGLENYRGSAIHPKHYYPSGTKVIDGSKLHQPIPDGTTLP
ncbi:MAG TPA: prepilin-type N-terminal cleavage/methylation domain-containing protein [Phycisphaerae bacterium]|nr:prepilin-type N-terminal cleavage/methylation domain-containing protein [Phycisphaerae bacterium]HOJ75421.1 prepilin-type N-terminal cleavage/methylation domain-containing protein [Phycisphaerae bacterium]HOM49628.1 prepilin-type N-terminal cleavage/methylation domain-containing protein [Phycisphaerae bacterium]HON65407.1 prepilin-type N-terminal cleavage/methylation domain-containing protein [Phycisphaerae bacterium]HOQ84115.1 prepilin-type N-terminal cleavage/methylation domain-containing 